MNPYEHRLACFVELRVKLPHEINARVVQVQVSEQLSQCFRPLPRSHDVPFDLEAQRIAFEQRKERNSTAKQIVEHLVNALLEIIQSTDSVHGYSPEERKNIQKL